MGGLSDASVWRKWALVTIVVGFFLVPFMFASGLISGREAVEACMVIGFVCLLVAVLLMFGMVFTDELKDNKPAKICFVIFAFIAGICIVIGCAIWEGDRKRGVGGRGTFPMMLGVLGALMAILAGIFGVLDLVGVSPPK